MYKTEQDKKLIAAVATRPARKSYQKTGSMNTSTSYPAKAKEEVKKKGWSKAAKGAVIGGASGAVLGGVIYKKNRALGAVIGGVVGAAGGFGIGKHLDKKDASK
ncbi:MAG: glycine zipper 2TM domain-containing protein [Chitinophagaceae bacterium]|nr:glycine zipper 2TM domain-containing protein [Chitinophagaceae bacterium]